MVVDYARVIHLIDLHCHILPGVDDGADSQEESLAMARLAVEDGVRVIVATPHTLNGVYSNPAGKITSQVAALQDVLSKHHIELELYPGADVHLCPNMLELIEKGEACTINNAMKFILLEPDGAPYKGTEKRKRKTSFRLKKRPPQEILWCPENERMGSGSKYYSRI